MDPLARPSISVVMPVRDGAGAGYLDAAIASIVAQTWRDWELVILDDGSADDTPRILARWAARDGRIRLARSTVSEGWGRSSDRVARLGRADVCARMDADDVAHPERLARQWAVLRDRPDVVLVGTLAEGIDRDGRRVRPRDRSVLLRPSPVPPFPHGTIMFRRAAFIEIGGYRPLDVGEDVDLCRRMAGAGRVAVLVDALYRYRHHRGSATRALLAEVTGPELDRVAAVLSPLPGAPDRPRALYYAAASAVWAGERPGAAPLRAVATSELLTRDGLKAGLLAGGALVSPRAARAVLGLGLRARDRMAGRRLGPRLTVDWEPRAGA